MANFPVVNNGYNDFNEYLAQEGIYIPIGTSVSSNPLIWTGQSSAGGQGVGGANFNFGVDNTSYYKSLTLGSNVPIVLQLLSYYSSASIGVNSGSVLVKDTVSIPFDILRKIDNSGLSFAILDVPQANPNSIYATVNQSGFIVTKSLTTVVNSNLKTYSVTVTLTNYSGSSSSGSLVISDTMPIGCNFVSATGTGFTLAQTGSSYTMTTTDVIANNGSKTYTLTVQGTTIIDFTYLANGYSISNDTDYSLRPMVWAGTSITNGTGISSYRSNYTYQLKNWIQDNLNVYSRVVNRAISSSQTTIMEDYRSFNNFYDFKVEPKFLFIEHGVNDIAQGISNATSVSNVTKMINYYRKKYPTCYIMILAPFPANAYESGLATYRTSMSNLVASYSSSDQVYLKYIAATGSVWNAATQGGTYTTDGVHVNAAGRLLILNAMTTYITTNNLTFP
jgi:lysophospholipase L1-like esterase